jgi:demethylmenaquinone methyltransferase/2-methoxy-6-polyprenyl-1,4-benzoquinol methylase
MKPEEKKNSIKKMFDNIAHRYDILNHLLSFGLDIYWRKKALNLTKINKNSMLIDIACGTGDFANSARKFGVTKIFGADLSINMLRLFSKKRDWIRGRNFLMAAEQTPLKSDSITNITVAFGVRNFYDIEKAFKSFHYNLCNGGKVTVLEFALPANLLVKSIYKLYFKYVLPIVGGIISNNYKAYKYLPASVEEFDKNIDLVKIFNLVGFSKVKKYLLTLGTIQVVIAEK